MNKSRYEEYTDKFCKNCKNKEKDDCEVRVFAYNEIIYTKCVNYERKD